MLRAVVLLLIVANAALLAWSQGWLPWLGILPKEAGREAHRLERQLRPDNVVLVREGPEPKAPVVALASSASSGASAAAPDGAALAASGAGIADAAASAPAPAAVGATGLDATASASAAASAPADVVATSSEPLCLEAAYYTEGELQDVERALGKLANKRQDWTIRTVPATGTWLVYMGPYGSAQDLERKQAELRKMGIAFEEVRNPTDLVPGLALGRFSDAQRANERLSEVQRKGVRSAQVQGATPARTLYAVRMNRADARMQAVAVAVRPALRGKRFTSCP